jgi:hypothetical protein
MQTDLEGFIMAIPFIYLGVAWVAYLIMRKHYP